MILDKPNEAGPSAAAASQFIFDMPTENQEMWGSSTWWAQCRQQQHLSPGCCHCGVKMPDRPQFSGSMLEPNQEATAAEVMYLPA